MLYSELETFLLKKMRMSHIYQPAMIKVLLRNNGVASDVEIAKEISMQDPTQTEYYQNITNNMVGKVLGALLELGNCLNLVESESLKILSRAYENLKAVGIQSGRTMPKNRGAYRALDCAVIQYIHKTDAAENGRPFDTVRCAFQEGSEAYEGASISSRLHIQVCVLNSECIKGYFLPQPIVRYNPYLSAGAFAVW